MYHIISSISHCGQTRGKPANVKCSTEGGNLGWSSREQRTRSIRVKHRRDRCTSPTTKERPKTNITYLNPVAAPERKTTGTAGRYQLSLDRLSRQPMSVRPLNHGAQRGVGAIWQELCVWYRWSSCRQMVRCHQ